MDLFRNGRNIMPNLIFWKSLWGGLDMDREAFSYRFSRLHLVFGRFVGFFLSPSYKEKGKWSVPSVSKKVLV
jgi:hypothetical protein